MIAGGDEMFSDLHTLHTVQLPFASLLCWRIYRLTSCTFTCNTRQVSTLFKDIICCQNTEAGVKTLLVYYKCSAHKLDLYHIVC